MSGNADSAAAGAAPSAMANPPPRLSPSPDHPGSSAHPKPKPNQDASGAASSSSSSSSAPSWRAGGRQPRGRLDGPGPSPGPAGGRRQRQPAADGPRPPQMKKQTLFNLPARALTVQAHVRGLVGTLQVLELPEADLKGVQFTISLCPDKAAFHVKCNMPLDTFLGFARLPLVKDHPLLADLASGASDDHADTLETMLGKSKYDHFFLAAETDGRTAPAEAVAAKIAALPALILDRSEPRWPANAHEAFEWPESLNTVLEHGPLFRLGTESVRLDKIDDKFIRMLETADRHVFGRRPEDWACLWLFLTGWADDGMPMFDIGLKTDEDLAARLVGAKWGQRISFPKPTNVKKHRAKNSNGMAAAKVSKFTFAKLAEKLESREQPLLADHLASVSATGNGLDVRLGEASYAIWFIDTKIRPCVGSTLAFGASPPPADKWSRLENRSRDEAPGEAWGAGSSRGSRGGQQRGYGPRRGDARPRHGDAGGPAGRT